MLNTAFKSVNIIFSLQRLDSDALEIGAPCVHRDNSGSVVRERWFGWFKDGEQHRILIGVHRLPLLHQHDASSAQVSLRATDPPEGAVQQLVQAAYLLLSYPPSQHAHPDDIRHDLHRSFLHSKQPANGTRSVLHVHRHFRPHCIRGGVLRSDPGHSPEPREWYLCRGYFCLCHADLRWFSGPVQPHATDVVLSELPKLPEILHGGHGPGPVRVRSGEARLSGRGHVLSLSVPRVDPQRTGDGQRQLLDRLWYPAGQYGDPPNRRLLHTQEESQYVIGESSELRLESRKCALVILADRRQRDLPNYADEVCNEWMRRNFLQNLVRGFYFIFFLFFSF